MKTFEGIFVEKQLIPAQQVNMSILSVTFARDGKSDLKYTIASHSAMSKTKQNERKGFDFGRISATVLVAQVTARCFPRSTLGVLKLDEPNGGGDFAHLRPTIPSSAFQSLLGLKLRHWCTAKAASERRGVASNWWPPMAVKVCAQPHSFIQCLSRVTVVFVG